MNMNREQKRMANKSGVDKSRPTSPMGSGQERTPFFQAMREVPVEMRKVTWPNKTEVVTSTTVVLIAITVLTAVVYGYDRGAQWLVEQIYGTKG